MKKPAKTGLAVSICTVVLVLAGFLLIDRNHRLNPNLNPNPSPGAADQERALRAEQLQTAEKLAAVFPDNDDAVYLLGLVHNEQGDSAAAMKYWERSLQLDASRADANDSLGYAFLLRDEYDKAEKY